MKYPLCRPLCREISFDTHLTPGVKLLVTACAVGFMLQNLGGSKFLFIFGLTPNLAWNKLYLWQPLSYIFLHHDLVHLFLNLLTLYLFGSALERLWGSVAFLKYFFISAFGAGILTLCFTPSMEIPTVGASSATLAILVAYAFFSPYGDRYLPFPLPLKAQYLVLAYALGVLYLCVFRTSAFVTSLSQVGGMAIGILYLNYYSWKQLIMRERRKYRAKIIRKRYRVVDGGKGMGKI